LFWWATSLPHVLPSKTAHSWREACESGRAFPVPNQKNKKTRPPRNKLWGANPAPADSALIRSKLTDLRAGFPIFICNRSLLVHDPGVDLASLLHNPPPRPVGRRSVVHPRSHI